MRGAYREDICRIPDQSFRSPSPPAMWLKVAQAYLRTLGSDAGSAHLTPIAKVVDGYESASFLSALSR